MSHTLGPLPMICRFCAETIPGNPDRCLHCGSLLKGSRKWRRVRSPVAMALELLVCPSMIRLYLGVTVPAYALYWLIDSYPGDY